VVSDTVLRVEPVLRVDGVHRAFTWSTLAMVPQSLGLLEELTCEENAAALLLFGTGAGAHGRADGLRAAGALLDRLGIGSLGRRYPAEVSLGQQQRVALARALIARPAVLLADEPTAHLDHRTIDVVVDVLADAVSTGTACLLATHDRAITRRAHRRLELRHGTLADTG
jgi:putative ABC transport system ATP-binding protein